MSEPIFDSVYRAAPLYFLTPARDALVPELYAIGKEWVGAVDYGVKDARQFFDENALYYASLDDLKKALAEITPQLLVDAIDELLLAVMVGIPSHFHHSRSLMARLAASWVANLGKVAGIQ